MHNQRPETLTRFVSHVDETHAHPATDPCLSDALFRKPDHFGV